MVQEVKARARLAALSLGQKAILSRQPGDILVKAAPNSSSDLVIFGRKSIQFSFSDDSELTFLKSSRHETNHTKIFECSKCPTNCASKKDLDRHIASRHHRQIRYHCNIKECKESIFNMHVTERGRRGFQRKDNWQRHMKTKHGVSGNELSVIDKEGIPTAKKIGAGWVADSGENGKGKVLGETATG